MADAIAYREWHSQQWRSLRLFATLLVAPLAMLFLGSFVPIPYAQRLAWHLDGVALTALLASLAGLVCLLIQIARLVLRQPGVDAPKPVQVSPEGPVFADPLAAELTAREKGWREERVQKGDAAQW